jgi:hypothetical protein
VVVANVKTPDETAPEDDDDYIVPVRKKSRLPKHKATADVFEDELDAELGLSRSFLPESPWVTV